MNVALTFVVLTLLLVVAVLALLVWSLWRRPAAAPVDVHEQANAQVYRDQSADLARELSLGHMSEAEHAQALEELKWRLRDDSLSGPDVATAGATDKPRKTVLALCLLLPVCAVLLYGSLGTPLGLDPAALARSAGVWLLCSESSSISVKFIQLPGVGASPKKALVRRRL